MRKLLFVLLLVLGACSGQSGLDFASWAIEKGSEITVSAASNVAKGVDAYCSIPVSVRSRSWLEVNKYTKKFDFDPQCLTKTAPSETSSAWKK